MRNSPHISTMYRSGMKYNSIVATNNTKQARQDKNGTDQLNMLEKNNCVWLTLRSFQRQRKQPLK